MRIVARACARGGTDPERAPSRACRHRRFANRRAVSSKFLAEGRESSSPPETHLASRPPSSTPNSSDACEIAIPGDTILERSTRRGRGQRGDGNGREQRADTGGRAREEGPEGAY